MAFLRDTRPDTPRSSSITRWLSLGLVIVLIAAMAAHLWRQADLAALGRLSASLLLVAGALQAASQVCLNASLLLPLQVAVPALGFWELYLVRTGGFLVGSVVPVAGGLAVRLAYLRSKGLTYLDFTWATLFSNVLALGAAAALSAAGTLVVWTIAGPPPPMVIGVLAAVIALSAGTLAAFEWLPGLVRHRWFRRWSWLAGMSRFKARGRMTAAVFAYALLRHVLNFATFGLFYQALSPQSGGFLSGGLVYALTSPLRIVNITPSNLGITEWFVALVGAALAFDVATGLIVALAFRGIGLIAQGLCAMFGTAWLGLRGRQRA
jgi:hypothetical protein